MNKLFNAVNNLFESEEAVTLTERGHKYIKKLPDDEVENPEYTYSKKDYIDTETGRKLNGNNGDIKSITSKRIIFDVIKHLAPTGYHFDIENSRWDGMKINLIKDGSDEGISLGKLKIDIDADDNVTTAFDIDKYGIANSDIFNREVTIKDVAQELAKEKGAKVDDEFMIDNGAEIKARYQDLKAKSTGTAEDLARKIEDQVKKLPNGALLKLKRTSESVETNTEATINENDVLNEDFDSSMPNWLKTTAIKGRNSWQAPTIDSTTQFKTLSKDELKNITKMAKKANEDGQILFIRLGNSAFWYDDRRWRQCLDRDNQRSEADMMSAINNEANKASGCITTNFKDSREASQNKNKERRDSREGGVFRKGEVGAPNGYWDDQYDKSGYKLDPHKYERMLRDLRKERLANSTVIDELENGNYIERFNELGKEAAEFIKNNLDLSYKDDGYIYSDHYNMNLDAVNDVKKYADLTSKAIYELMARINYIRTGDTDKIRGEKPGTDVEGWLKDQASKVEALLTNFKDRINRAEEAVEESVKIEGKKLEEAESSSNEFYIINAEDFQKLLDINGGAFDKGYLAISKDEANALANKQGLYIDQNGNIFTNESCKEELKEYDNGSWMKYQNQIEDTFENAKAEMDEDAFMDFCDGVEQLAKNYSNGFDNIGM